MPSQMGLGYVLRVANVTNIFLQSSVRKIMSVEGVATFEC